MTEVEDAKNDLVVVRSEQQVAIDNRDTVRANELYAKELELRSVTGLGEEQVTFKSTDADPSDYLLHTNLLSNDDLRVLGELEGNEDVITLADIVGASVREMVSTNRRMAVDAVVSQEVVDDFLDGFSPQEKSQLKASVTNLPLAMTVASRFVKLALKKNPDLDIPDDFNFWLVALPTVERIFYRLSRNRPVIDKIVMTDEELGERTDFLNTLDAFHERIAEFQARGRYTDANLVYQEEQRFIAESQGGDQRIVGSALRTA